MKARMRPADNAVITLRALQRIREESESTELVTTGLWTPQADGICTLEFQEIFGEDEQKQISHSTITVSTDGKMVLQRSGAYRSELIFEEGKRYLSSYSTPYGDLHLGVFTKAARLIQSGGDAQIELFYTLDSGAEILSENEMTISIKEKDRNDNL